MDVTKDWIYDLETFKYAFTFSIIRGDGFNPKTFECSWRTNEIDRIIACCDYLQLNGCRLVGFNNVGFDYPILHELLTNRNAIPEDGKAIAKYVWKLAQKQIESFRGGAFGHTIKADECVIPQVDLYRIWHFNNKAKATGLKMLEFNMRLPNIEDLPYKVDEVLTSEMIDKIKEYNAHDVWCTKEFYHASATPLQFRDDLSVKLGKNLVNADDTKIGAEYFQMKLEEAGVPLREYKNGKSVLRQTKHPKGINLGDCLFHYYDFSRPEFKAVHEWFSKQTIMETKGVFSDLEEDELGDVAQYAEMEEKKERFKGKPTELEIKRFLRDYPKGWIVEQELKATEHLLDADGNHIMEYHLLPDGSPDLTRKMKKVRVPKKSYWGYHRQASCLNVVIDGLRIDFGVGGIHASLSEKVAKETAKYVIRDADVSSMYPNLAISNNVYPAHLGEVFCVIYKDMYEQRKSYPKGTSENGMLKLALNGTYGKSNDQYSVFFDPKFTMTITVNGQLSLLMLADWLLQIEGLKIIQLNTDGITCAIPRDKLEEYNKVCEKWQATVKLELEYADYSKMFIRDVNNYIALYTNGKVKRKGAYQYEDLGWHQNQSSLVIPMAAEAEMVKGIPVEEFIRNHKEKFDFLLRTKVPRSSSLVLVYPDGREVPQQNICRYYPCKEGGKLIKKMPALETSETGDDRELSIDKEWTVKTCNNIEDFKWDVDYDYYISEAKKLVIN